MSLFWKKLLIHSGVARLLPSIQRILGGGESFLPYFSDRTLSAPLGELLDPAYFPDVQGPDAINLALGAPRCDLPLGALRGVNDRRAPSAWGLPELREALREARKVRDPAALHSVDDVLITPGAGSAFATAIDAFLNPGSAVVLFDPTSPIFPLALKHRRARIRWVPTEMDEGQVRFPLEQFTRAMRGASMLVLADPCNPTGGLLRIEDLEQIAFWAKKYDVLIYLDESFAGFAPPGPRTHLTALPAAENRLLLAGSFSKTYGLSAARVGWLMGNRHLLGACAVTSSLAAPFVSPLSQHVGLTALRSGAATAEAVRDEFAARRLYVHDRLQSMGLRPNWTSAGYFFWVPVSSFGTSGQDWSRRLMESKRVLVNPGLPFGPSGRDHVRISFAIEEGRLRQGLGRLAGFLDELSSESLGNPTPSPFPAKEGELIVGEPNPQPLPYEGRGVNR